MAAKTTIRKRIEFRKLALDELYKAYEALVKGGVKSYVIDDRELTRLDLAVLSEEISEKEKEIDMLEAQLKGSGKRRAVGVVPREW